MYVSQMPSPKTRFTIGREPTCDIPLPDDSVSRLHAELTVLEGGKLFLTDCKSSNGTFVLRDAQPRRITQELILPTDRVQFGRLIVNAADLLAAVSPINVTHRLPAAPPPPPPPPPPPEPAPPIPAKPARPRLVRCECGAIKTEGTICTTCNSGRHLIP